MNLKHYLLIFQLEAYHPMRFLRWVIAHYIGFKPEPDKQPVWTPKAKQLYWLAIIIFIGISLYLLCTVNIFIAAIIMAILWFNIYICLILALAAIKPYEIINRLRVKQSIKNKIKHLKEQYHLTVIGITGSFGKTSSKMVISQVLPKCHVTPKSYNTMFGIFKTIDYELNKRYKFFVCEMGAYKRGDVKEFCELVSPDIGVLTGINEQHLERFGSIENTIQAKFEILTTLSTGGTGIVNLDNPLVKNNLHRFKQTLEEKRIYLIGYSVNGNTSEGCKEIIAINNWHIENGKSVFELSYKNNNYKIITSLIGKGHLSNILAAIAVATSCGQNIDDVIERISKVKQIPHRLELKLTPGITILDDTYSSNPSGFREALDTLKQFTGTKVLITPGIVELGDKALEIHKEIGTLAASICDEIVLVGNSHNLNAMKEGIFSSGYSTEKVTQLAGRAKVQEFLQHKANTVVLMENDLPDQYL
jgi:UDP-N-acetylmuramoyl-tripeptide--D-alanyl-D-alanine ligase